MLISTFFSYVPGEHRVLLCMSRSTSSSTELGNSAANPCLNPLQINKPGLA